MKKLLLASALLAASTASFAEESAPQISANVTLATDYVFRGVSQTNEKPAIQGGFDYEFQSGFYLGAWASNVNFGDDTSTEMDFYGGFSSDINDDWGYDVSVIYFDYASESTLDYIEVSGSMSWKDLSFGVNYSNEYLGDGGDTFFYPFAQYSLGLANDFSIDFHIGYSNYEPELTGVNPDQSEYRYKDDQSYIDYSVVASKSLAGVDLALGYYGNDAKTSQFGDSGDDRVVFSISKSF